MREEMGPIEGPLTIEDAVCLRGTVSGGVSVRRGGYLDLVGTVDGDLDVRHGGVADIHGTVTGNVHNAGSMTVDGVILGRMDSAPGATTRIETGAMVSGQRR